MPNIQHNPILMFTISVSIFGVFIVLLFTFNPPTVNENFFWRKLLVGSIFSLICTLGIFVALFPRQCSKSSHFRKEEMNSTLHHVYITMKGHHPDCKEFSAHVIHINSYTICAACTGLLLGALIAFTGTAFYSFGGWSIEEMSFPAALIGVVGVILGFFQIKFRGFIRLMLNIFFVLGAFLILVGIDELTQNLFVDLFLIVLIVFWLFTRIMLSRWDHWRICSSCKSPCEVGEQRKVRLVSAAQSIEGANNY